MEDVFQSLRCPVDASDIKNISFLFSRYSYRNDVAVEKFVIIDAKNADDPFKHGEKPFDAVILTTVLEHVHNPASVIRSLTQHLRPGGVLVFDYIKGNVQNFSHIEWLNRLDASLSRVHRKFSC